VPTALINGRQQKQ